VTLDHEIRVKDLTEKKESNNCIKAELSGTGRRLLIGHADGVWKR